MSRRSIHSLKTMKTRGERFVMVTCYDYPSAVLTEAAGIPAVLVGDSLGPVLLGYDSTLQVTLDEMIHHTKPVVRGTQKTLVVADLPFGSYQASVDDAVRSATRLLQEGGANAVKLEGGRPIADAVRRLVDVGIPVMGHIGLTPQSVNQLGGYKVQGKTVAAAARLASDASALEAAGCFALVLECVPVPVAKLISQRLQIPTIGIGSGPHCDGQIQVLHDLLGLIETFTPRHAGQFASLAPAIKAALSAYQDAVRAGHFPAEEHSFAMAPGAAAELLFEGLPGDAPPRSPSAIPSRP